MQLQNIEFTKSGKLHFFSQMRKDYELQGCLEFPINKVMRSNLTKLKISSHHLEIENGKYSKPYIPKDSRCCHLSKTAVEDEL